MSQNVIVRRLRPYLFTSSRQRQIVSNSYRRLSTDTTSNSQIRAADTHGEERKSTNDYQRRVSQLQSVAPPEQWYPRVPQSRERDTTVQKFKEKYEALRENQTDEENTATVTGRIRSIRTAGSKLIFLDIQQRSHTLQAVFNLTKVEASLESAQATQDASIAFKVAVQQFVVTARKGDIYSFHGHPHRTSRGELSIMCTEVPTLQAPSLHQIPDSLDPESKARKRHVGMLVDPALRQVLQLRHIIEEAMYTYFDRRGFTRVHTPMLTSSAGGAIARPFETEATEYAGERLQLRIAPELWLKRLIIGGTEKVYEFGPAFRNEGVDATHNPEFYTCEFYEAYANLDELMARTEKILRNISIWLRERIASGGRDIDTSFEPPEFEAPFRRVEFLPALQEAMGMPLPDLSSDPAVDEIKNLFTSNNIDLPSNPTLPRLLDTLAAHYLEPFSKTEPIFITHHPACMSPLAKHFICPATGQTVSARAELFINGMEMANMYEEENSPFEQRRKFLEQAKLKGVDGEAMEIDESYLEALEWGMPPTGGWGCGVDRLVMLFAKKDRIGDVLPFGSLRNVVGAGRRRTRD